MRVRLAGAALALAVASAGHTQAASVPTISMMSYNVRGLPWPIARGRPAALDAIAGRLRDLRASGRQPHVVALQEAFVPEAKAIGAAAGYRYVAFGPGTEDWAPAANAQDRSFAAAGSVFKGEGVGKHVDSGLAIFSDYPILSVRRIVYPVCAGYDCLAAKGAMIARVAVPGIDRPLALVDTHLNSNASAGVPRSRSLYAYRRQLDTLSGFIAAQVPRDTPLLIAGDFNTGPRIARRGYFQTHMLSTMASASRLCDPPARCGADTAFSMRRARDWLMYRSSPLVDFVATGFTAPFGHAADGSMLSDHVGILATYEVVKRDVASSLRLATR
jgi:endonuclease/exonuclease/phosphatase family metal-dependent hydrolase